MKFLLDTHTLIYYYLEGAEMLSVNARAVIEEQEAIYVSVASLWEMGIKKSIGKLNIRQSIVEIADMCRDQGIGILDLKAEYIDYIGKLPDIHRDPFDRIILATAKVEEMVIVTKDSSIWAYPDIRLLW